MGAPPLAGSTASEADVKKGDRIVAIDGVSMVDKTSFEVYYKSTHTQIYTHTHTHTHTQAQT